MTDRSKSNTIKSLKHLSYKTISKNKKTELENINDNDEDLYKIKQKNTLHDVKYELYESVRKYNISVKKWISSARIPVKIQKILQIMDNFTKIETVQGYNIIRVMKGKESIEDFQEFWKDFKTLFDKKIIDNNPLLLQTFYLLCYLRLNYIFSLDDVFEGNEEKEIFIKTKIEIIPKSDILPLIIYKELEKSEIIIYEE